MSSCLNSCGLCGRAYQEPGESGRDDEVASALGRGAGEGRGLDLDEAVPVQDLAGGPVHLAAQPQGRRGRGPAQVEVPVPQPRLLADLDVLVDLERQRGRAVEHLDGVGDDLDLAGRQGGVLVALGPAPQLAGDPQHVLGAQVVRDGLVPDDHLDDAAGVAQVEERHPAVIAAPGHPPGEGERRAGELVDQAGTQGAGLVGAQHG
jgi:hypothetical protein